jgi:hypothetical protein
MSEMPSDTKAKISKAVRRACQSPTVKQRRSEGIKRSWTPARRAALSRERREFWQQWRRERDQARAILAAKSGQDDGRTT